MKRSMISHLFLLFHMLISLESKIISPIFSFTESSLVISVAFLLFMQEYGKGKTSPLMAWEMNLWEACCYKRVRDCHCVNFYKWLQPELGAMHICKVCQVTYRKNQHITPVIIVGKNSNWWPEDEPGTSTTLIPIICQLIHRDVRSSVP